MLHCLLFENVNRAHIVLSYWYFCVWMLKRQWEAFIVLLCICFTYSTLADLLCRNYISWNDRFLHSNAGHFFTQITATYWLLSFFLKPSKSDSYHKMFNFYFDFTQWFLMAAKLRKKIVTSIYTDERCCVNICHALFPFSWVDTYYKVNVRLCEIKLDSITASGGFSKMSHLVNKTESPIILDVLLVYGYYMSYNMMFVDVQWNAMCPKPLNHVGHSAGRPAVCSLSCGAPAIILGKLWVTNTVLQTDWNLYNADRLYWWHKM